MSTNRLTILRTAVGSPPVAGMIKELKKRNIRVVGTDCNPLSAGFAFCDKFYVVPKGNSLNFIDKILEICDREKPQAIIAGPEEEILSLAKNKKIFIKRKILVLVPDYGTAKLCADKILTHKFFIKNSIPTPKAYFNRRKIEFPAIIKPRYGRGSKQVYKVENKQELAFYLKKVKWPIIQEFVKGTEYSIDIFSDLEGLPLSIVPRVRIQVESGIAMKSRTVYDEEIINMSGKITTKLKLIGPACLQCIKTVKGIKFIEINTRFGGGSILSVKADPTIITNLIKIIKGGKTEKSRGFKQGITMLRYYAEVYIKNI